MTTKPRIVWRGSWRIATIGQWMRSDHAEKARVWCDEQNRKALIRWGTP